MKLTRIRSGFTPLLQPTRQAALALLVPLLASAASAAQSTPRQLRWSDPASWPERGFQVPTPGADVVIDNGRDILLDLPNARLGSLRIAQGSRFTVSAQTSTITLEHVIVQGDLTLGTETNPFAQDLTITFNGDPDLHDIADDLPPEMEIHGTRGIFVLDGTLSIHGSAPDDTWGRLESADLAVMEVSGSDIRVMRNAEDAPITWLPGDDLVISPTDYFGTIADSTSLVHQVVSTQVAGEYTIAPPIPASSPRWALPQYLHGEGATGPDIRTYAPAVPLPETNQDLADDTPVCVDQRAYVGNLSRNICIQSADDRLWNEEQFGVHIMVMRMSAAAMPSAKVEGIEIRRAGQRNKIGRYPFHWHMHAYQQATGYPCDAEPDVNAPDPAYLSYATDQYFRKNSIHESRNRGIVIHGTNHVEVSDNVLYDIEGHGIFLEDGSERFNTIERNLILRVRNTSTLVLDGADQAGMIVGREDIPALKLHETSNKRGSSGLWISNPDNWIRENVVADTASAGFWLAFSYRTVGLSSHAKVEGPDRTMHPMRPYWMPIPKDGFRGNVSFCNKFEGFLLDLPEVSACTGAVDNNISGAALDNVRQSAAELLMVDINSVPGDLNQTDYRPYVGNLIGGAPEQFTIKSCATWKNNLHGFWNRSVGILLEGTVSADNCGRYFAGDTVSGAIFSSLVIQDTLNSTPSSGPSPAPAVRPQTHVEWYPSGFATYHSGADVRQNLVAGFIETEDEVSGTFATDDYYLIPVEKGQARNHGNCLINSDPGYRFERLASDYALAGALWDPHATWLCQDYNQPCPKDGKTYLVYDDPYFYGQDPPTSSQRVSGGVLSTGPFYGFNSFLVNALETDVQGNLYLDLYKDDIDHLVVNRIAVDIPPSGLQIVPVGDWEVIPPTGTNVHNVATHMRHFVTHPDDLYILTLPEFDGDPSTALPPVLHFGVTISNLLSTQDTQIVAIPFHGTVIDEIYTSPWENYYHPSAPKDNYTATDPLSLLTELGTSRLYWHDSINGRVWVRLVGQGAPTDFNEEATKTALDYELYGNLGFWLSGH